MATPLDLGALSVFTLASYGTPGPNTLLLMRSGARFGFLPTGPHVAGINVGMAGLVLLAQLGVGGLLIAAPGAFVALRWACFAYLLWLAVKVLRDRGAEARGVDADARPMSAGAAALFQLVNPKAWMMAVTGVTAFSSTSQADGASLGTVIAAFVLIGTPCMCAWALWGAAFHRVLRRPGARRAFNVAMAALIAGTALSLLHTEWTWH